MPRKPSVAAPVQGRDFEHLREIAEKRRALVAAEKELDVAKANYKLCQRSLELAVLDVSLFVDRQLSLPIDDLAIAREKAKDRVAKAEEEAET